MKTKRNYKNVDSLKNKVSQLNLYDLMRKDVYVKGAGRIETNDLLTDNLIEQVCDLLGGRPKTKEKMSNVIKNQTFSQWYLERIIYDFDQKRFTYCAGQDYPAEIAYIRRDLVNRY